MDETAYYFCSAPAHSHAKQGFSGLKQVKKRIIVAVTSNADGPVKIPLLFIGTARQPRCFQGQIPRELGVQYDNSGKGWMTTALFQRWIEEFNNQMCNEKRRVLLLLDNASSHRIEGTLSNVTIHMFHPNTTSHLQPQDAGVIRSFKAQTERVKNLYVLDKLNLLEARSDIAGKANIERISKSFFDVDVLTAIRWVQEAWDNVTRATVAYCWCHTAILDDDLYELIGGMDKFHVSAPAIRQLV